MAFRKVNLNFLRFIYKPWAMFFISILACVVTLIIERLLGIEWDFHPDSNTYIVTSKEWVVDSCPTYNLRCVSNLKGNLFYLLVDFFHSNIQLVMFFNILIYSITNSAISNFFRNNCKLQSEGYLGLLFLLVIFNPYRTHLSLYVLKDTLIIASLVFLTLNKKNVFSTIFFIFGAFLRNGWIIYFLSFINISNLNNIIRKRNQFNKKNLYFISFALLLLASYFVWFVIHYWHTIVHVTTNTNGNMTFRSFDSVPSFYELGLLGSVIRAFLWPLLYLTGVFIFFSPSIMYLPIAIGSFFIQFWVFNHFKNPLRFLPIYLSIFLSMGIFAFIVSGFTSYIRYCLPLMAILPILLINEDNRTTKEHLTN